MANEKRLIDANALLEKVQFRMPIDNKNAEIIAGCVDITRRLIENALVSDAVEVVHCKDCVNYHEFISGNRCIHFNDEDGQAYQTSPNDFCSHGERRG